MKAILALDQGTTSSRSILFNHAGEIVGQAAQEFTQIFPQSGWVEHDPWEIVQSQLRTAASVIDTAKITNANDIAIGITNQRETTVVWNRATGQPIYNAIVWQDRRTADYCNALKKRDLGTVISDKTGLVIDAYFSASKIRWILENVPGAREDAEAGKLAFGTIDTWLLWNLTAGVVHCTDSSNASRTLLFNIHTGMWDEELLAIFEIPAAMLPLVVETSGLVGITNCNDLPKGIQIAALAGDQQAALFGQACYNPGMAKNTYGTGCFMLMHTGEKPVTSNNHLLTTVAWSIDGAMHYALEGSVFIAGAAIQWLRDGLGIIGSAAEVEALAASVPDTGGVYFVPAFAGLGAPHWDQNARGVIVGITRGTSKAHLARAAIESIAFQSAELVMAMRDDAGIPLTEIRVDGGATVNNLLMQFQSDLVGKKVVRPKITETTALGAAYLAGLAVGFWKDQAEIEALWAKDRIFVPSDARDEAYARLQSWLRAVERSRDWA